MRATIPDLVQLLNMFSDAVRVTINRAMCDVLLSDEIDIDELNIVRQISRLTSATNACRSDMQMLLDFTRSHQVDGRYRRVYRLLLRRYIRSYNHALLVFTDMRALVGRSCTQT